MNSLLISRDTICRLLNNASMIITYMKKTKARGQNSQSISTHVSRERFTAEVGLQEYVDLA